MKTIICFTVLITVIAGCAPMVCECPSEDRIYRFLGEADVYIPKGAYDVRSRYFTPDEYETIFGDKHSYDPRVMREEAEVPTEEM